MLSRWVVEIWDPSRRKLGTGYAVAPNRVLTAHHVVGGGGQPAPDGATYWLRLLGTDPRSKPEAWWLGRVLWSNADSGIDLALLEPVEPKDTPDADPVWSSAPVARFAQIAGSELVVCQSTGFPEFQRPDEVNDTYGLRGEINPNTGIKERRLTIAVRTPRPRDRNAWAGLSGAALFAGEWLIGVITNVDQAFEEAVVIGTPLAALKEDPEFCAALGWPCPLPISVVTGETGRTVGRRAPRPVYWSLPSFPPNYQKRPEAVRSVKSQLFGEARAIGVHGMAGIGKTVLATALVHDKKVRPAFPDGIVWLTFGREADATQKQAELARALTGEPHSFRDWEEARGQLSQLTETDQLLVVLNDVWRIEQYDAFARLGPHCRLLVTTRDRRILERLGSVGHELQLLSPKAALEMLAGATASSPSKLPAEAPVVARECGYLPLALASIGALIAKGRFSWPEALDRLRRADLKRLTAILPDYEHKGVLAALEVSVDALEPTELECFLDCAVFREDALIPEAALLRLWSQRFDDPEDRRDVAFRLVELTLLRSERSHTDDTRYSLHDLYHDFLQHAAAPLPSRHEALLHAYERDCPKRWASFPEDDGYFIDCVPYHLKCAGRDEELRDLLFDLSWLRRKLVARSINSLIADAGLDPDPEAERLGRTLRMSGHVLAWDRSQLEAQLLGRLSQEGGNRTARLLKAARGQIPAGVLVPRGGKHLLPPGALLQTLKGHGAAVFGAVVLPDGEHALSWSQDHTLRVWDLASGESWVLEGHRNAVSGAVASADGACALSWAINERTLRLWDLARSESRVLEGHRHEVSGAVVCPDGARALSWSVHESTLRLWDLASGESRTLQGHRAGVSGAVVFADGARALSWSAHESPLRLWDLASGKSQALQGHRGGVAGAVVWPDGARALSWSEDGRLRLWDLASGASSQELEGHRAGVSGAVVLMDGARALSWSAREGMLRLWNLASGESRALEGHHAGVSGTLLLADGAEVLSWSWDDGLRLWDLASGESRAPEGHNEWLLEVILGVAVLADGARALSWSAHESTLRLWKLGICESRALEGHSAPVHGAVALAHGTRALSWSEDGTLRLWDLASGDNRAFEGHSGGVSGVVLADGGRALSWSWHDGMRTSADRTCFRLPRVPLRLWDLASGKSRTLEGHSGVVFGAAVLADGGRALSWSGDYTLRLWDLANGGSRKLKGHSHSVYGAMVLADGARALSWSKDHTLRLWDLASGKSRVLKGHRYEVSGAVVWPDGKRALSWSRDYTLRLWDLASGDSRALEGHSGEISGALLLGDGARALSWSDDGTLRLWNLANGESCALEGHHAGVSGTVAFADGARALSLVST